MQQMQGKWAGRFLAAAVIQGLIAVIATVLIVDPLTYFSISLYFNPAMVITAGGGGTWLFTGNILFLVAGTTDPCRRGNGGTGGAILRGLFHNSVLRLDAFIANWRTTSAT